MTVKELYDMLIGNKFILNNQKFIAFQQDNSTTKTIATIPFLLFQQIQSGRSTSFCG